MPVRQQYNQSTLKAIYNNVTKKVQVYPCVCALCSSVPWEIKVTFANINDDTNCCNYGSDSKIYGGGGASYINGQHILTCSKLVQSSCCWTKVLTGSFGSIDYHAGANCGYFLYSGTITQIVLGVTVFETGGTKYTRVWAGNLSPTWTPGAFFDDTLTFSDPADCLNLGNTFNNEASCSQYQVGSGGTAVISLP